MHRRILIAVPRVVSAQGDTGLQTLDEQSVNPAKQMAVRRAYAKATGGREKAPPPNVINTLTVGTSTVTLLTNQQ
jgi:hypothetical protein